MTNEINETELKELFKTMDRKEWRDKAKIYYQLRHKSEKFAINKVRHLEGFLINQSRLK